MFILSVADLKISIDNKYEYTEDLCRDYLSPPSDTDFSVCVSDEEISAEDDGNITHKGYLESLAIYRKIAEKMPEYNGFLMHGVVVDVDGTGVAFLAKSGVGKTTHLSLWQQLFGNRLTVVNGDKPLVRFSGGNFFAYGTPWAGKENLHKNTKTMLKKICFIERSRENECYKTDKSEIFEKLIRQIYRQKKPTHLIQTMDLIGSMIENTEFFTIKCNTDISAAKIASEVVL